MNAYMATGNNECNEHKKLLENSRGKFCFTSSLDSRDFLSEMPIIDFPSGLAELG